MRYHGKVVLSSLFNMDGVHLLDPEGELHQIIAFHVLGDEDVGIVNPVLWRIEPVRAIVHDHLVVDKSC